MTAFRDLARTPNHSLQPPYGFARALFTEHDADWSCLHQPAALGAVLIVLEVN
ncbi:MAG: hypothetical protein ACAH88_03775 [Roseimicrobium sp.]